MNLVEEQCVEDLADLFCDFLPGRGDPLTREEMLRLNEILLRLSIKIPELNDRTSWTLYTVRT